MALPVKHLANQLPSIKALGHVVASMAKPVPTGMPPVPSAEVVHTLPPIPLSLLRDYNNWTNAVANDTTVVPAHLFPQWSFPAMVETFEGLPFRFMSILNQGAKITVHRPLPAGETFEARAQLVEVEESDSKVRLTQRVVTGIPGQEPAFTCETYSFVPKKSTAGSSKSKAKRKPLTTAGLEQIGTWPAAKSSGPEFAFLTGDLNPIHWIPPYAKLSGFKNTILHGFGILARSYELIQRQRGQIKSIDVRFIKPLVLPNEATVWINPKTGDIQLRDRKDVVCMVGTVEFV